MGETQNAKTMEKSERLLDPAGFTRDSAKALLIANGAAAAALATWLQPLLTSDGTPSSAQATLEFWLMVAFTLAATGTILSVNQLAALDIFPSVLRDANKFAKNTVKDIDKCDKRLDEMQRKIGKLEAARPEEFQGTEYSAANAALQDLSERLIRNRVLLSRAMTGVRDVRRYYAKALEANEEGRNLVISSMGLYVIGGASLFAFSLVAVLIGLWRAWVLV